MVTLEDYRNQQRVLLDMFDEVLCRYNRLCKVFNHFYKSRSVQYGNADFWQKKAYEEYKSKMSLQDQLKDEIAVNQSLKLSGNGKATAPTWINVREKQPADGVLVVVKTKDGAKYFGSAYEGKLMSNVEYWYPLPQEN